MQLEALAAQERAFLAEHRLNRVGLQNISSGIVGELRYYPESGSVVFYPTDLSYWVMGILYDCPGLDEHEVVYRIAAEDVMEHNLGNYP